MQFIHFTYLVQQCWNKNSWHFKSCFIESWSFTEFLGYLHQNFLKTAKGWVQNVILWSNNFVTFEGFRGTFMARGILKLRISQNTKWSGNNTVKLLLFFCGSKEQLKASEWKNLVTWHKVTFVLCSKHDSLSLHYHVGLNFIYFCLKFYQTKGQFNKEISLGTFLSRRYT